MMYDVLRIPPCAIYAYSYSRMVPYFIRNETLIPVMCLFMDYVFNARSKFLNANELEVFKSHRIVARLFPLIHLVN